MSKPVIIDLETRSACDLRIAGGFQYALHETTRLLTVAWQWEDKDYVWFPGSTELPQHLLLLHLPGVECFTGTEVPHALASLTHLPWLGHNSWGFDEPVWEALQPNCTPKRWLDSLPLCAMAGLPMGLNQVSKLLANGEKYTEGSKLLKQHSVARGLADCDADNVPMPLRIQIAKYNLQDVRLTRMVVDELEASLHVTPFEAKVQAAHRAINRRGVRIDQALLSRLHDLSRETVEDAVHTIRELTGGALDGLKALRSRDTIFKWMKTQDVAFGTSLAKKIVEAWIDSKTGDEEEEGATPSEFDEEDADDSPEAPSTLPLVIKVLQLRQAALRVTAGKLAQAANMTGTDGIARGLFAYHVAGSTGRWGGRRIQFQNLPTPKKGVDTWTLYGALMGYDNGSAISRVRATLDATWNELLTAVPSKIEPGDRKPTADDAAGALLRNLAVPHEGDEGLLSADFSAIEARVLAWLAGETWLEEVFRAGGDPYIEFCRRVTGRTITKGDYERKIWKETELACGFQVGGDTLSLYMAAKQVDLAKHGTTGAILVDAYRDAHPAIAGAVAGVLPDGKKWRQGGFWNRLKDAVCSTVLCKVVTHVGRITYYTERGHLYCLLPSGKEITYRNVAIRDEMTKWGKMAPVISYQHSRGYRTKLYGGKLAENVTQGTARECLAWVLVNLEEYFAQSGTGAGTVLHVHDEPGCSGRREDYPAFMRITTTAPPWADGLIIDAEGAMLPRYAKAPPPGVRDETWRAGAFRA